MSRKGHRKMKLRNAKRRGTYRIEPTVVVAADFSAMDRTALRRECKARGIAYSQLRKADMIAALEAAAS